jgi:ABC-type glutathione transport system ATPase component
MYMRLAFAIAVAVDPEILLIDEILAVGDANFQRKCQNKMNAFKADGKTIVIVTHDLGALERYCDKVLWLDHGELQAFGDVQSVMKMYLEHVAEQQRENLLLTHDDESLKSRKRKRWGSKEAEITSVEFLMAIASLLTCIRPATV